MIFITLYKFRHKPTKADLAKADKVFRDAAKQGVKPLGVWWTLGRYDAVRVFRAQNVQQAMSISLDLTGVAASETLVAVQREEAAKLI